MATVHPLPVDDQRGYNGDNEGGPSASEAAATMVREANAALWSALQYADIVLLNKLDLLGGGASTEAKRLRQLLERAAPWAQIIGSEHGKVPLQLLLMSNMHGALAQVARRGTRRRWWATLACSRRPEHTRGGRQPPAAPVAAAHVADARSAFQSLDSTSADVGR